jgi:hypothetical protein
MTVSGVQAAGVMGATRRGGGAVQSWVKPTEAPGAIRWRRCRANGSAAARRPYLRCTSAGRESLSDEIARQCLSQSRRLCSPLSRCRAAARFVTQGRDRQALGVPNFSCEAAFLLDAMAALPRKWVSGGAPTLP